MSSMVFKRLRRDIIDGHLSPAKKLNIDGLRERYGVGASPIREALSTLVAQGFVYLEDQRGYWVAPISAEDLHDILASRSVVEVSALRASILHGDDEWEANVIAAQHRLARASERETFNVDVWEDRHRDFHLSLLNACGSAWLFRFCSLLHDQFDRYRRVCGLEPIGALEAMPSHKAIMEAAVERKVDDAVNLLEEHKNCSARNVLAILESLE